MNMQMVLTRVFLCLLLWMSVIQVSDSTAMETWEVFTDPSTIRAIAVEEDNIWAVGRGGLVRQDRGTDEVEYITTADGLPGIDLVDVVASDGQVWIATATEGLARYTPGGVNPWFRYQTLPQGLADDRMLCLEEGPDGAIWYGTESGYGRIHADSHDIWTNLHGLDNEQVHSLAFMADTVLIGTGSGIYRMNPGENPTYLADAPSGEIRSLTVAADSLWVLNSQGELFRDILGGSDWPLLLLPVEASGLEVKAICADDATLALSLGEPGWTGRDDAVWRYDGVSGWLDLSAGLPNTDYWAGFSFLIYDVITAVGQELWIGGTIQGGVGPGLVHFDGDLWSHTPMSDRPLGTITMSMKSSALDALWCVSDVGGARFSDGSWTRYPRDPSFGWLPRRSLDILEDSEGWVWMSEFSRAFGRLNLHTDVREIIATDQYRCVRMLEDDLGNRWFCHDGLGADPRTLSIFSNPDTWLEFNPGNSPVPGITVDRFVMLSSTRIACLVGGIGLWVWETNGTLDNFDDDTTWSDGNNLLDPDGLIDSDTQFSSIAADANGELWIGQPSGLVRLLRQGSRYVAKARIGAKSTFEDGMLNSQVWDVACDPGGNVWVGTQSGLSRVRLDIEEEGNTELLRWTISNWTNEAGREQAGSDLHGAEVLAPLPHPRVFQVEVESAGDAIWLGTDAGSVRFSISPDPPGAPEQVLNAWVYPNPVLSSLGHTELRLGGIEDSATVKVFNLEGQLVQDVGLVEPEGIAWDLKTRYREQAVSGVYVISIESEGVVKVLNVAVVN